MRLGTHIASSSHLRFLLKLCLTLGAFYLVWRQVDWQDAKNALSSQNPLWIWLAVLCILMQIAVASLRWYPLLLAYSGKAISCWRVLKIYYSSLVFNIFMPGTLGSDFSRIWMTRSHNLHTTQVVYSVVIDRLFSLISLLILVIFSLPFLLVLLGLEIDLGLLIAVSLLMAGLMGIMLLYRVLPFIESLPRLTWLKKITHPLSILLTKPIHSLLALLGGVGAHLFAISSFYALAMSLSLPISYFDCLVLVPVVVFASALPISLSGWGIRELGATISFALIGIAPAYAALIAIQVGLIGTLLSLGGGIIYLVEKQRK